MVFRLYFLFRLPLVYGMDGAWYLSRTKETLQYGLPQPFSFSGTPPIFFWLSAFVALFAEINAAVKIVAAVTNSLMVFTMFILVKHLTKKTSIALIAASLTVFTLPFLRLMETLYKNALAVVFIPLFLYFFLRAREGKKYLVPCVVSAGLILLSHPQTFTVAVTLLVVMLAFEVGFTRRMPWADVKSLVLLGLIIACASLPFIGEILWAAGALNTESELTMGRISDLNVLWQGYGFLWIPCAIGFIISLRHSLKTKKRTYLLPVSWFLFAIIMTQPLLTDFTSRMMFISFFPVAILIGVFLNETKSKLKTAAFIAAIVLVFIAALVTFWNAGNSMRPLIREDEVPIFLEMKKSVPENSIIIMSHWGIRYWTEYLTELEVQLRLTPDIVKTSRPIYAFVERGMSFPLLNFEFVWRRGRFTLYKFVTRGPPRFAGTLSLQAVGNNPSAQEKPFREIVEEFKRDFPGRKILDARAFGWDFLRLYYQARQENALVIAPKEMFRMERMLQDLFIVCAERYNFLLLEPKLDIRPPSPPPMPLEGIVTLADAAVVAFSFPVQAFNYLNIPMKEVVKAAVGLPLMFLFWGFVLGVLKSASKRMKLSKLKEPFETLWQKSRKTSKRKN